MNDARTQQAVRDSNLAVLANMAELAAQVTLNIAGNEVANTHEGALVTPGFFKEAFVAKFQSCFAAQTGDR